MGAATALFVNGAHAGRYRRLREACSDAGLLPSAEELAEYTRGLDWEAVRDGALTPARFLEWKETCA